MEGWVIFVTGLNEEVNEEDVEDKFNDFGKVREVRMNLDHRTGYVKVTRWTEMQSAFFNTRFRDTH